MNAERANAVRDRIYAVMNEYLGDRRMKAGAGPVFNAIFKSIEKLALAERATVFGPKHKALIDRFSEPPDWEQAQVKLEEVGARRRSIEDIVRKAVQGED